MKNIYSALVFIFLINIGAFAQSKIYTPTLRAPANEATGQMPDALLDWDAVTGQGTVITYEVQLAQTTDFSNATTFPTTTLSAMQMSKLNFDEVYYWRVRAADAVGLSEWSAPFSFKVVASVTITAPNNQSTQNPDPLVKWNALTGITNYDIQIDTAYAWATEISGVSLQLNDVFELDDNNAWAVGNTGTILHRTNNVWSEVASGTTQNLSDLFFVASDHGYAIGAAGTILHYDGTAWTAMTSGTTTALNGIYFTSATNGYVVGNGGLVLKYDGTSWTTVSVGVSVDLYSVHGLDANNIWVGGKTGNFSYYNGSTWTNGTISNRDVLGLWAVSPTKVWAAAKAGRVYFYNGSTWTEQTSGSTRDLNDVCFIDENTGYIVGNNGTLLYYNGTLWQSLASGTTQNLYGIYLASASSGYLVGNAGVIIAYQGDGFNSPYLKSFTTDDSLTEYRFSNLVFGSNHYFRMRARHELATSDWSTARSFFVVASPTLASPANNATNIALDTLVKWNALTGVVRYTVQLAMDEAFSDPYTFESSTNEYRFQGLNFGQNYFWRVSARHASDVSDWSPVFKFLTINTVNLLTPANNATNVTRLPRYSWSSIRGTEKYIIQVSKNSNLSDAVQYIPTQNFYQTQYILDPAQTYFWRVRAVQALDSTSWSEIRSYVTEGEIGIGENNATSFSIYPNPGNGQINVSYLPQSAKVEIEIYNLIGKKIFADSFIPASSAASKAYDLRELGKGIYLVKLYDGENHTTKKLIIE